MCRLHPSIVCVKTQFLYWEALLSSYFTDEETEVTEFGKHPYVHTVNEFGFKLMFLTCMLCGPVALCDGHMKRL